VRAAPSAAGATRADATDALWGRDDVRLAPLADPAAARRLLADYLPHDGKDGDQARARARMLAFVDEHPDALLRTCVPGHLTASALVIDPANERGLLTLHRKLGRWLQLGGHCDGDANLAGVALREAIEESGIVDLRVDPRPIDLDVHAIPARPGEPEHLHLDTRFLVFALEAAEVRVGDESLDLAWFRPDELERVESDDSVRRLFRLAFG